MVESVGQQLRNALGGRSLLNVELVVGKLYIEVLGESHEISEHSTAGQIGGICQFGQLGYLSAHYVVHLSTDPGVSCQYAISVSSDPYELLILHHR